MKDPSMAYQLRLYTVSLTLLLTSFPHTSFGMEAKVKTLIKTTSEIDPKMALIGIGVSASAYFAYKSLTKKDHAYERDALQSSIAQSKQLEKMIAQIYSPLIKHHVFSSFANQHDAQEIENLDDQPALPAYERLYPEAALPILDDTITQQVNLGNLGDPRVTVQFPFTAFQQKLTTDLATASQSITSLNQLESRCHKNFHDLAKRANATIAHDSYAPILADIEQIREELSITQRKLFLVNRRMPFLPGTKTEYPRFEAWETEQKRITAMQQLEARLTTLTDEVNNQNTRIENLAMAAEATHQGLETTRSTIETLHTTHHASCNSGCTRNMTSLTEIFAPVAQFLNSLVSRR